MPQIKRETGLQWLKDHARMEMHKSEKVLNTEDERREHLQNAINIEQAYHTITGIKSTIKPNK